MSQKNLHRRAKGALLLAAYLCIAPALGVVLATPAYGGQPANAPGRPALILVDHPHALFDRPVHIRVIGLAPDQVVTIGATAPDAEGQAWTSSAQFAANDRGVVDLEEVAPNSGSYSGVDPMGLFWSMTSAEATLGSVFVPADATKVTLTVTDTGGATLAQRHITRLLTLPGMSVKELTVVETGLAGTLVSPSLSFIPRPTVMIIGGGPTAVPTAKLLAAHGFPALALIFVGAEGLPQTLENIPLEYFDQALDYLKRQPGVAPDRILTLGVSGFASTALRVGTLSSDLVSGVIAINPYHATLCNAAERPIFTWQGQPVPCAPNPRTPSPNAIIPVENIRGPVLAACGVKDVNGLFCAGAQNVINRRAAHQVPYQDTLLSYPDAVDLADTSIGFGLPYWPNLKLAFPTRAAEANAAARADLWPKLLTFIRELRR